jgi:hypothetical protein
MRTSRLLAAAAALSAALPLRAAERALDYAPPDAAAIGMVRFDQLRSSDLAARLFAHTDRITCDGEAETFLSDAGLDPKKDLDEAVVALVPGEHASDSRALAIFEGRFDAKRVSRAIVERGGVWVRTGSTPYLRLPRHDERGKRHGDEPAAVAFPASGLAIAGSESSVASALSGPHGGLGSGDLAAEIGRVSRGSVAWVVVDGNRVRRLEESGHLHGSEDGPAAGVIAALRTVSLMSFEASVSGKTVAIAASGVSGDEATRENLEDVLRGVMAAWRMAAQSKSPELLAAVRKFRVGHEGDRVTITGELPEQFFDHGRRR